MIIQLGFVVKIDEINILSTQKAGQKNGRVSNAGYVAFAMTQAPVHLTILFE